MAALALIVDPAAQARVEPALVQRALGLTPAESETAALLAEGRSAPEIAAASSPNSAINAKRRRHTSPPGEVLPCWRDGMEAVRPPAPHRDISMVGVYSGMRLGEIVSLRWERLDLEWRILRDEETKTGEALELPIARHLGAVFERHRDNDNAPHGGGEAWLFHSSLNATGHLRGASFPSPSPNWGTLGRLLVGILFRCTDECSEHACSKERIREVPA